MIHRLLRYLGLARPAMGNAATIIIDEAFGKAHAANPSLWRKPSTHIPTRQAKFEEFCLWLAVATPPLQPQLRQAVLELAIDRLDLGLREAGVGDTTFSREIRAHAAALNGRLKHYETCIIKNNLSGFIKAAEGHKITSKVAKMAWPKLPHPPAHTVQKTLAKGLKSR